MASMTIELGHLLLIAVICLSIGWVATDLLDGFIRIHKTPAIIKLPVAIAIAFIVFALFFFVPI